MTTVAQAIAQSGLAAIDAQVLLAHALGVPRTWLVAHADEALAPDAAAAFAALADRRRGGEPVAYLTGTREFFGLTLAVTPAVLIPRPETETLVEFALARLPVDAAARVLDLGTGSGAIALAIAHARPRAQVLGADCSAEALAVARANARRLGLRNVEFVASDWFDGIAAGRFDVVVGNPPYVAAADAHLGQGDLRFEPRSALTPGGDGLGALRCIVTAAPRHLAAGATLAVEHGHDQAGAVAAMFVAAGYTDVAAVRDLAGIVRVTAGVRGR
ncbi:MAG: peptide chain release factor N(5)-glutamine methyltransferase [Betaproteobacteria bacterium]|nr:peptide chain release factor N(5)-glutamine methyltransferase [Betaproteobacteria bacterium]